MNFSVFITYFCKEFDCASFFLKSKSCISYRFLNIYKKLFSSQLKSLIFLFLLQLALNKYSNFLPLFSSFFPSLIYQYYVSKILWPFHATINTLNYNVTCPQTCHIVIENGTCYTFSIKMKYLIVLTIFRTN